MPKHGKRYREAYAKVDRERQYSPVEVGYDQVKKI